MTDTPPQVPQAKLFGHPAGLFTLFFAEMWERFSYYGMRALLTLYMVKGFLGFNDKESLTIYGAYTALVYMTPFFGGMLADKLLGQRRAVILGGVLMSLGHLTMTIESEPVFYAALGMIIVGNGFFKPNISTMVGQLYPPGDLNRRGGFTIFYMGINLGAALSPLLCGYVGETYGWHLGFGLATVGMLIGLAVFWAPTLIAQLLIGVGAIGTAGLMIWLQADANWLIFTVFTGMAIALLISAGIACTALARGGIPADVGAAPNEEELSKPSPVGLSKGMLVYVASFVVVPILAVLVGSSRETQFISPDLLESWEEGGGVLSIVAEIAGSFSRPAGAVLTIAGLGCLIYLFREAVKLSTVARQRLYVALILTFFQMLFWSFFEQAGGSMNLFADRNVNRVLSDKEIAADQVGQTLTFRTQLKADDDRADLKDLPPLTQDQFGLPLTGGDANDAIVNAARLVEADKPDIAEEDFSEIREGLGNFTTSLAEQELFTVTAISKLREASGQEKKPDNYETLGDLGDTSWEDAKKSTETVTITLTEDHVGMGVGGDEIPASTFQSANAIFILMFGLVFAWLWGFLRARNWEPNTAVKFALGLGQLGLGFVALWYGATTADDRGMVSAAWLLLAYLLHTTGELCLSPVGLSMITELSPKKLVSTMMGTWFLATAFSNYLAAIIGKFTAPSSPSGEEEVLGEKVIPPPVDTLETYSTVFLNVGFAGIASGVACLALSPLLKKWMHMDQPSSE